jgi:hypothetical protein
MVPSEGGTLGGKIPALGEILGEDPTLYLPKLCSGTLELAEGGSKKTYMERLAELSNSPSEAKQQQKSTQIEGCTTEGRLVEFSGEEKQQQQNKRICEHEGCTTPAHADAQYKYCSRHNPKPKKCIACQKNNARRAGGLCESCHKKQNPNPLADDQWCAVCIVKGRKNKPRKKGGICSMCKKLLGPKYRPPCRICGEHPRSQKGGICYKCKTKEEEVHN